MASDRRRKQTRIDDDGVKIETAGVRPGVWLLVGVAVLVVVVFAIMRRSREPDVASSMPASVARNDAQPIAPQAKPIQMVPVARAAPTAERLHPDAPTPASDEAAAAAPATPDAEATPAGDAVAEEAHEEAPEAPMFGPITPGEKTGVALFPPPGTKPIKRGILVPEDFELPPGYVRHYQATDDGRRVPAILMFHPDYNPVDEHGVPIPIPENRVVPPELAPPGLPIQMLELPEDQGKQDAQP
ncbi:MAG TPA: hypothetical protein VL403_15490 [Candidatus Kryptonia bacterium]|nr:hypothetical protein [Candidatus Kryptonia bacterium]